MTQEFAKALELSPEAQLRYDLLTTALDYQVPFADAVDFANRAAKFVLFGNPDATWRGDGVERVDAEPMGDAMGGGAGMRTDAGETIVDLKAWQKLGGEPVQGVIIDEDDGPEPPPEPPPAPLPAGALAAIEQGAADLSWARNQLLDAEFPAPVTKAQDVVTKTPPISKTAGGLVRWTPEFRARLKTLLPDHSIAGCAEILGTTRKSLSVGMAKWGIRKTDLTPRAPKAAKAPTIKVAAPKTVVQPKTPEPVPAPVKAIERSLPKPANPEPAADAHYEQKDDVSPMTAAPPRPVTRREAELRPQNPADRAAIDEAVAQQRVTKLPSMMELHPYLKPMPGILSASDAAAYLKSEGLSVTGGLRIGKVDGKRFSNSVQLIEMATNLQRAKAMAAWKKDHAG